MQDSYIFYMDKLEGSYQEAFAQVHGYMMAEYSDSDSIEEHMQELLDIFLIAQEEGKPVEKITGKDMETFCKKFCSCFGWKSKIYYALDGLKTMGWIALIYGIFDLICYGEDMAAGTISIWNIPADWNWFGYLVGILCVVAINWIIGVLVRDMMFRLKKVSMKVLNAVSIGTFVIAFIVLFSFLMNDRLNILQFPLWIQLAVSAVYLVFYYTFNHKRLAERKKNKVSFWQKVTEDLPTEMDKEMWKKYHKVNRRRIRRGKEPLDMEAFLDKEEKECDKSQKLKWLYQLLPFAMAILTVGGELAAGNRDAIDLTILAAVMLGVEGPLMYGLWKIVSAGIKTRRQWIEKERSNNVCSEEENCARIDAESNIQ